MKLSYYEGEEALDVLADLMEPAVAIMSDSEVKAIYNSGKPKILIAKAILKNQKKAVVELVSALHRKKPGEYKFNMITLLRDILDILNDEEIANLFTLPDTVTSSGSVTENTEANET